MRAEALTMAPSLPSAISAESLSQVGRNLFCRTTASFTLASSAVFTSNSDRSRLMSSGFSRRMCLRAAAAICTSSRWVLGGVNSKTDVMEASAKIASMLSTAGNPQATANVSRLC
jgi:hypothetical protein